MAEVKQKNLKLTDDTIELLRLSAYEARSSEADAVEYGLVTFIAFKILDDLRNINSPVDHKTREKYLVRARWKADKLNEHDSEAYWQVQYNSEDSHWELQKSSDRKEWEPWPWKGVAQVFQDGGAVIVEQCIDDDDDFEIEDEDE